jgi:hypothetical protein
MGESSNGKLKDQHKDDSGNLHFKLITYLVET